jgi:lipopolysaccharide export system permease protein
MKRLDSFMLQRFLPLLLMTFFICLFIVLMQFLFRMIDDLVGKGLSFDILGELFFYAALTMVPMALPLAILLASLMVFGNLGEKLELTAMKAAGISLFRIMRPLIVTMVFIAIGAFFFQNYVLPVAQSRMWTLMFSVRQKTPEVEIPERLFYDEIPGMNLYVDHKNPETGMLYDMIIYDLSGGTENSRVILADSGRFSFTEDKTRLFLELHHGELFENLSRNQAGLSTGGYMPFRREEFSEKQIYFAFDANFNRMDESGIRSQYVGQNVSQLRASIDSIGVRVDSIGNAYGQELRAAPYVGVRRYTMSTQNVLGTPEYTKTTDRKVAEAAKDSKKINIDSVFAKPSASFAKTYLNQAIADAKRSRQEFEYRALMLEEQAKLMRRHEIEMQRKFTLSFAVLVFFFIGAPLGAIIKKGGIGTPLVTSVFFFIVYYIIDNTGYNMARDGKVAVWIGIWLSTLALTPLGVFFTRKAVDDSAVFNADAYRLFFARLIGKRQQRTLMVKEVIMNDVVESEAIAMLQNLRAEIEAAAVATKARPLYMRMFKSPQVRDLREKLNAVIEYLSNSADIFVIDLLNKYPFVPRYSDLANMIKITDALIARIDKANEIKDNTDNPQ